MSTYDTPTKESIASEPTRQAGFDEFPTESDHTLVFGNVETVAPDGDDARVARALTESHKVDRGENGECTFTVHSGETGEHYAVDLDGPGGETFCQCADYERRGAWCKHQLACAFTLGANELTSVLFESEPVATDGGTEEDVESTVRETDTLEESDDRDCLQELDNCPGPDASVSIEDGTAEVAGTIPCVKCYSAALGGESE